MAEAETTALLARMTTQPVAERAAAIDRVIVRLKTASIWATLDCLYVPAIHNAQAAALNWVSTSFPLTANGTPTFEANRGWQLGTNKYLGTAFNPATASTPKYVLNSMCVGVFSLTDNEVNGFDISCWDNGAGRGTRLASRWDSTTPLFAHTNNADADTTGPSRSFGHVAIFRPDSANSWYYRHGFPPLKQIVRASVAVPSGEFLIGAVNVGSLGSYSSRQYAFAHIGSTLTEAQLMEMSAAFEEFLL